MNRKLLLIIFGLSGMTALIYEIIWIRPLSLVFGTTIYAVSTIIAAFIFGLAIGSWIAGRYADRMNSPLKYFAFVQVGIGFFGILLLPIFSYLPGMYLEIFKITFPNQHLFMFIQVLMSMLLISIPAALMGSTLPIMMKEYSEKFSTIGKDVGKLDAVNSTGAMIGTLAAGFLLIPVMGIQNSIIITALINVGIGMVILTGKKYLKYRHLSFLAVGVVLFVVFFPSYDAQTMNYGIFFHVDPELELEDINFYLEHEEILSYEESLYSTVMVTSIDETKILGINGKTQCSTDKELVIGLEKLAFFPYDLFEYNYGNPKNALNIGLGCGITSDWLSHRVQTTTLEIDPAVARASTYFFEKIDHNLIIDDARNWLLRNDLKFDIITSEPSDPFQNQGSFFTREFFMLANDRLSEDGIISQWVPIYEMTLEDLNIFYNTFHSVFPYVYVYQMEENDFLQLVFIGSQKQLKIKENDFYLISYKDIVQVKTVLNTDDRPTIEFSTAINFQNPSQPHERIKIMFDWLKVNPERFIKQ